MRRLSGLMLAVALAGCGGAKSVLTKDVFARAAQDCGARGARFVPAVAADGAPDIHVVDTMADVNGQRIDVPRCLSAKLAAYQYGRMVLDAMPAGKTN